MYDNKRYFTMTGAVLPGYEQLCDVQDALDSLYAMTFSRLATPLAPLPTTTTLGLDDEELITAAERISPTFPRLWRGDTSGYPSHSEARSALVYLLAGYTKDPEQLERLFMASALYREGKWPRERDKVIGDALRDVTWQYELPARPATPRSRPRPTTPPTNGTNPDTTLMAAPYTDLWNAELLTREHGADLRWCEAFGSWFCWDGTRWTRDESGEVMRRAKDAIKSLYAEAAVAADSTSKQIAAHAKSSQSVARLKAMIDLARSEPGIPVRPDDLDRDPWMLTV